MQGVYKITNKRNNLIFAVNNFFNTFKRNSIKENIDNDKFALAIILNWIIGVSDINKPIEIFVLSNRMAKLLKEWKNNN